MSKSHNKKRNVGIIFEQLVGYISEAMLEKNHDKAQLGLSIIKNNFKPGSELYREFRLFNSFIMTQVDHAAIATRILEEAKKAAIKFDRKQLTQEKAMLIREINHELNDSSFYSRRVKHYRDFATIQTLLNDWRTDNTQNFDRITKYENEVCKWLLTEKVVPDDLSIEPNARGIDSLTLKIMAEKFNKKYNNILNYEQSDLIKEYIFSSVNGNVTNIQTQLRDILYNSLDELDNFETQCDNKILCEKITTVRKKLNAIDTNEVNDDTVAKVLAAAKLKEQLLESDDE